MKVQGARFVIGGAPYRFVCANFWTGMNLAAGDPTRLRRELDRLWALGVTNVRVMGASEGPGDAPWRVVPALKVAPACSLP